MRKTAFFLTLIFIISLWLPVLTVSGEEGFSLAAENKLFILRYSAGGDIELQSKTDGTVWYSSPPEAMEDETVKGAIRMALGSQLVVGFSDDRGKYSSVTSMASCVNKGYLKTTKIDDGVEFLYDFKGKTEGFSVPVRITLEKDYLKAEIIASKIKETGTNRVMTVALLPFFGAGSKSDNGYSLIPDGSGALINFNNGKTGVAQYRESVYGRDPALTTVYKRTVKQTIALPVFGIKKNDSAFLSVITKGDFSATIISNVAGSKESPLYNQTYAVFDYRSADNVNFLEASFTSKDVTFIAKQKTSCDTFEVRYYPLSGDKDYNEMANRYRTFLMEEKGLDTAVPTQKLPFYLDLTGAFKKDATFLGFPATKTVPLTKYSEAADILKALQNKGIDNIACRYTGWMKGGLNSKIQTSLKYEGKLGGKKGFTQLMNYTNENDILLFPEAEFQSIFGTGNGYHTTFDTVKTIGDIPAVQNTTKLNLLSNDVAAEKWFLLKPAKMTQALTKYIRAFSQAGYKNISAATLGSQSYSDFNKKSFTVRDENGEQIVKALKTLNKNTEQLMLNGANAYALPYSTHIVNAPLFSSRFDVADAEIPFYQMVIHSLKSYSGSPANMEGDPRTALLKAVQTGASLHFSWFAADTSTILKTERDNLYASGYKDWLNDAAAEYKELNSAIGSLSENKIEKFIIHSEYLTETVYQGGARVLVNFSETDEKIDGVKVTARNFAVIRP